MPLPGIIKLLMPIPYFSIHEFYLLFCFFLLVRIITGKLKPYLEVFYFLLVMNFAYAGPVSVVKYKNKIKI